MKSRILLAAAAAGILGAQLLAAQPVKPAARPGTQPAARPAGPWARVPALTSACYQGADPWNDSFQAAFDALQQDRYRQEEINSAIDQQATDAFSNDPMAIAQRMQQALMEDPQNAQKLIETMQQAQQAQEEEPARFERENQLEAESEALVKQYKAELARLQAPNDARMTALNRKVAASGFQGEGLPPSAYPEYHAILKARDSAYAAHCAKWWVATGPIHAYLKRYRDFLVLERAPHRKKWDEKKLDQFEAYGVDASRWRSMADHNAAEDYMNMAMTMFREREHDPRCRRLAEVYNCG